MCGIIVSTSTVPLDKDDLSMLHQRGPDMKELKKHHLHQFGFTRLAIMGLSDAGNQPFFNDNAILVANAEIYNFEALQRTLTHFNPESHSDCEVLLPLFDELGAEFVNYLDGEFAIVLYDATKDMLLAARDPIGIRPLF